ncbi:hypothetical protein GGTG_02064 [Gaeumannomyces tritici R3-111a-1]|uniref:Uncharacterized protein n=1 Tax=Gaeumannomyces tritici (strain R3-111a-1) TaxID=644352 RepID=J3NLB6_GAET3|nr:hypothetical protein GGTG_02064 [Gaeumannomyces tritici R3-111a-1]EJT82090.1 hypothetical protein GGTG_02064 [Gaeumannomyces tritici R3-111a-1]
MWASDDFVNQCVKTFFFVTLLKAVRTMKKEGLGIKNYARVGPEGQTKAVSATVCNAGFPLSGRAFMIARLGQQEGVWAGSGAQRMARAR